MTGVQTCALPISRVRGVVLDVYPHWGWALQWARSPIGRLTMLAPPLLALAAMELMAVMRERALKRELGAGPHDPHDARRQHADGGEHDLLLD